jgi:DNA-binding Lrp family transcriptional regulator
MQADIKKLILKKIEKTGELTITDIQEEIDVSRQAVHKHLKKLLEDGKIRKIGSTRGAKYILSGKEPPTIHRIRRTYRREGLQEDKVLESVQISLNLQTEINSNAREIFSYAFTEILNNAIEHSQSGKILIKVELLNYDITFTVRDYGVGIFIHMKDRLGLLSEEASIQELLKGKATTDPEHHTGEGLFFTSRMADKLKISSYRLTLVFDNKADDIFTGIIRFSKGTDVNFIISRSTKKSLTASFNEYAGKDYDYTFAKTSVKVNLFSGDQSRFISRSIARRLLYRLDQFEEIIIDFSGVKIIGQGFADQIFRVFQNQNPHLKIKPINASDAVKIMIAHVSPKNNNHSLQ